MNSNSLASVLIAAAACVLALDCSSPRSPKPRPVTVPPPALTDAQPADYDGLHSVVAYSKDLYCGSQPEGPGLETLANMGIRTIISVDGAQPDVDEAAALGMRYVHLPIGYDGIDEARKLELMRAYRDLPGPIYVHCHHGKHRSAGAASAMAVGLGKQSSEGALTRMKVSGTAPNYTGLFACATDTHTATAAQLASASNAFPARWKTTGIVQSMVDVDHAFDNMKAVEKASWSAPKDHPDLVPAAEVGRISHVLRELKDDAEVKKQNAEFHAFLKGGIEAAESLEKGILDGEKHEELAKRMKALNQSCKDCHVKFRD